MGDFAWELGWWAMLLILHLVITTPALVLLWWLRRRAMPDPGVSGRLGPALLAATLVSPALLPSHFPLLLPLVFAYLGSVQLGVAFSPWDLLPALVIAAIVLKLWPMRSNNTVERDAPQAARPSP